MDEHRSAKIVGKWKHGFVECSAKTGDQVTDVFKELLNQAKVTYRLSPALRKRRQSLPGKQYVTLLNVVNLDFPCKQISHSILQTRKCCIA